MSQRGTIIFDLWIKKTDAYYDHKFISSYILNARPEDRQVS
jgi:hypothetical protein